HSPHSTLHSFPTRRSSDLSEKRRETYGNNRRDGEAPAGPARPRPAPHRRGGPRHRGRPDRGRRLRRVAFSIRQSEGEDRPQWGRDRKSTRLNSSHVKISYA